MALVLPFAIFSRCLGAGRSADRSQRKIFSHCACSARIEFEHLMSLNWGGTVKASRRDSCSAGPTEALVDDIGEEWATLLPLHRFSTKSFIPATFRSLEQ